MGGYRQFIICDLVLIYFLVRRTRTNRDDVQTTTLWRRRQASDLATKGCWYELRLKTPGSGSSGAHLLGSAVHPPLWIPFRPVVRYATAQNPDQTGLSAHAVPLDPSNFVGNHRAPDQQSI